MLPHNRLDIGELRWPDDPYGKNHRDHREYEKPKGRQKNKLQFKRGETGVKRKIRIYDVFRHWPMSFVKTIKPLLNRGLITPEAFQNILFNKLLRGSFHDESIEKVKLYTSDEIHALCVFMHMMRDAFWNALGIKLKSFHSPANAAGQLLRRIGIRDRKKLGEIIRGHSWPVKSVDLEHEQIIAHWSYYGGRFESHLKGFLLNTTYNYDLASAYPYAMQFLPSMCGGHWERTNSLLRPIDSKKEAFFSLLQGDSDAKTFVLGKNNVAIGGSDAVPCKETDRDILKRIETCSILSIFKVKFCFKTVAPFYPLPYRMKNGAILFPSAGYGYYMRDDILAAIVWCKKFKEDAANAIVIEEANWFHPSAEAERDLKEGRGPFVPIAEAFQKRIDFDKIDPGGPEQLAIKNAINSGYGKLAERLFRGIGEDGEPIIPPHVSPWYAAAITAHTRRELMVAALLKPRDIIQFATDAVHARTPLNLPRLKSEADIKKGLETKLLGDWTWKEVPGGLMVQSGLAFFLKSDGTVADVKCRGLPLKDLDRAKQVVDEIFRQWRRPYDPTDKEKVRSVRVPMQVFMPITSAIVSPRRDELRGYWGIVSKTIGLDDPGSKREIRDDDRTAAQMDMLDKYPMQTSPRTNPSPETISTYYAPDWVENEEVEAERQKRGVKQYKRIIMQYRDDISDEDGLPDDETELLLIDNEFLLA